jgi:threonine/homoserine/homoserine lactone efflux protein
VVPTAHLVAFALTASVIIAIPGPSVVIIAGRALALGRRAAVLTVVGNTLGEFAQVVCVAFGIGTVIERSVALFTVVKLLGAGYLIFLGVRAIRDRRALEAALAVQAEPSSTRRLLLQGTFLAAILPEFVDRSRGNVPVQILILGLVFSAIALVSDTCWGLAAGTVRAHLARSPERLRLIGGAGGLAIILIGVRLALTGRKD